MRWWHIPRMHPRCKSCLYCKVVEAVCFWEPPAQKGWKRPALFITSAALTATAVLALRFTLDRGDLQFLAALSCLFMAFTLLGVAISFRGCDSCVARFLGRAP
jgi:hypothetical protein